MEVSAMMCLPRSTREKYTDETEDKLGKLFRILRLTVTSQLLKEHHVLDVGYSLLKKQRVDLSDASAAGIGPEGPSAAAPALASKAAGTRKRRPPPTLLATEEKDGGAEGEQL